jgi:hypothetical protein
LSITSSEVPESLLPLPPKAIDALSGASTLVARFANTLLRQRRLVVVGNAGWLLIAGVSRCDCLACYDQGFVLARRRHSQRRSPVFVNRWRDARPREFTRCRQPASPDEVGATAARMQREVSQQRRLQRRTDPASARSTTPPSGSSRRSANRLERRPAKVVAKGPSALLPEGDCF